MVVTSAYRAKRTQLTKKVQCRTQWFDGLGNRYIYVVTFRLRLTMVSSGYIRVKRVNTTTRKIPNGRIPR